MTIKNFKFVFFNLLLIVFGLLFCVIPSKTIGVLNIIISAFLMLFGVVEIFGYCFCPKDLREILQLFEGIFFVTVGILLDFFPTLFVIFIGIGIVFGGIKILLDSLKIKKQNEKWKLKFSSGLIILISGLVALILNIAKVNEVALSIYIGCILIFSGILNLTLKFFSRSKDYLSKVN